MRRPLLCCYECAINHFRALLPASCRVPRYHLKKLASCLRLEDKSLNNMLQAVVLGHYNIEFYHIQYRPIHNKGRIIQGFRKQLDWPNQVSLTFRPCYFNHRLRKSVCEVYALTYQPTSMGSKVQRKEYIKK
jgi:hypothetical protein